MNLQPYTSRYHSNLFVILVTPLAINIVSCLTNDRHLIRSSSSYSLATFITISLFLNLYLIFICNPSVNNPGPRKLSVLYNNVRGFVDTRNLGQDSPDLGMTKVLEFQSYIYNTKPDIVVINETWLKPTISSSHILPDTYKVFRLDRSSRTHPTDALNPKKFRANGGGVLIAHREDIGISSHKFNKFSGQAELLSIFINLNNTNICISTFYRVGTLSTVNFNVFRQHLLSLTKSRGFRRHLLIGDFNLPGISWPTATCSNSLESDFVNLLVNDLGHTQVIDQPTHISGNTLDLVFTNCPDLIDQPKVLERDQICVTDHLGVTLNIDFKVRALKGPDRYYYNFAKANFLSLNVALARVNWDNVITADITASWDRFKSILVSLCDQYIPKKRVKGSFAPLWWDHDCDRARNKKETLRKRHIRVKSDESRNNYCRSRKVFKSVINGKMNSYFGVGEQGGISKRFWSHIKSSKKSARIPDTVFRNDISRSDPVGKANLFNSHFFEQFTSPSNYDIAIDYPIEPDPDNFFSLEEVHKSLTSINSSKACGADGIHGKVLKNCAGSLSYPLWLLFNNSFRTGYIPDDWKLASIVPVFKKGEKKDVSNYRPISLLSLVSKLLEDLVRSRLLKICGPLIHPSQHGFMQGRSCNTQLIPFTYSLAASMGEGCRSDVIYFDFARAFDSCNHDLILSKLKYQFNVDGEMLNFIKNYLMNRTQRVVVDGQASNTLPVISGVPQGSLLGPILFIIFINDIFNEATEGTGISLYADDTKIWRRVNCMSDHHSLQETIDNLQSWAVRNRMVFHPNKCHTLSIARPSSHSIDNDLNEFSFLPCYIYFYELDGIILDYVTVQKDLGILITHDLKWTTHCDHIVSLMRSSFNRLRYTCYFLSNSSYKRSLYYSMVRSFTEHCNPIWNNIGKTELYKFERLQKSIVKWIRNEPLASYTNSCYFKHLLGLNILPIKELFIYNNLKLFYKIIHDLVPLPLPHFISPTDPASLRVTRKNFNIIEGLDITSFDDTLNNRAHPSLSKNFFHTTTEVWNSIPYEIRQSASLPSFLVSLKKYLFDSVDIDSILP